MNKIKTARDMIDIHNDAHMTDGTSRARTGKEHEVAALQVVFHNRIALTVLVARRTVELNVHLSIYIACKPRAVEGVWSRLSRAVTCPYMGESLIKDIVHSHDIIVVVCVAAAIKKIVIANPLSSPSLSLSLSGTANTGDMDMKNNSMKTLNILLFITTDTSVLYKKGK